MSVNTVNERLARLTALGTSVWLDQIGKGLIDNGDLKRYVDEYSLRGVTSNPAIFEGAVLKSDDYDDIIAAGFSAGKSAMEIYKEIAVSTVKAATDVLRPVWEDQNHHDGFVSLEVAPDLARDTTGRTLEEARMYWGLVGSPNLMIKIPGTPEGLEYIEQAIYEGININVTLLFSVDRYSDVAEAYIKGLERRRAEGMSLDVHSVASFFVSRVDTVVDKQLDEKGRPDMKGKAAVANARAAYIKFKEIFYGERFAALKADGAPVQRPLWASTGTKNPEYSDVLYVDTLAGPETVNTMPLKTLEATAAISDVTSVTLDEDPGPVLAELEAIGIDMHQVTEDLLDAGIDAFVHSLDGLIEGIENQGSAE
ncbi:MAG: transaldolase [Thermoleophilaceae bacterium]|nr:transaldolase [Thermoleophilaceae bacterium]